uniref:Short chain dehydrogenase n=1 Tax=Musca domestica TaxID=7370 RepID=A0A1I8N0L0_MUSDO
MFNRNSIFSFAVNQLPLIGLVAIYPALIVASLVYQVVKWLRPKTTNVSLSNEVAVITGSARGLGREIAIDLAKRGCRIAIVDIQQTLAEETAEHIAETYNVKTKAYKVDVSDHKQIAELKDKVTSDLGDTTILVNNAAILFFSTAYQPPLEEVKRMINVNLASVCYTTEIFLPKMKELNRGHVVNIASASALLAFPNMSVYAATKAGVRHLTWMLRSELALLGHNITATTVMPTFLNTNKCVEELIKMNGIQGAPGSNVARRIVEGMLAGEDELVIPGSVKYMYKLLEVLPTYIKERFLMLIIGNNFQRYIKSSQVSKLLQEGTIKCDSNNNDKS